MRGESFLYPSAVTTLVRDYIERGGRASKPELLTPRELQVLKLVAEAHTVEGDRGGARDQRQDRRRHRQNILDKLGMSDRVELTRYAIRRGLIQP